MKKHNFWKGLCLVSLGALMSVGGYFAITAESPSRVLDAYYAPEDLDTPDAEPMISYNEDITLAEAVTDTITFDRSYAAAEKTKTKKVVGVPYIGIGQLSTPVIEVKKAGQVVTGEVPVVNGDTLDYTLTFKILNPPKAGERRKYVSLAAFCKDVYPYLNIVGGIKINGKAWKRKGGCANVEGSGKRFYVAAGTSQLVITYQFVASNAALLPGEKVRGMPGWGSVTFVMGDDTVANPDLTQNFCDNFSGTASSSGCPSANAKWRVLTGKWDASGGNYLGQGAAKSGVNRRGLTLTPVHLKNGTVSASIKTNNTKGDFPYKNGSIIVEWGGHNNARLVTLHAKDKLLVIEERANSRIYKRLAQVNVPVVVGTAYPVTATVTSNGAGEKISASLTVAGKAYTVSKDFTTRVEGPVGLSISFSSTNFDDVKICQGTGPCTFISASPTPTPTSTTSGSPSPTISCTPRPACLDAHPACEIPEPIDGWCPPSPTPSKTPTPTPTSTGCLGGPVGCQTPPPISCKPSNFGLKEGDMIAAFGSYDPDIYIINQFCYKRVFLNPIIFSFYGQLGGFANVKSVTPQVRDSFATSMIYRECETNSPQLYALEATGEDSGLLHKLNLTTTEASAGDLGHRTFCINLNEYNWYTDNGTKFGTTFNSLGQIPPYHRGGSL